MKQDKILSECEDAMTPSAINLALVKAIHFIDENKNNHEEEISYRNDFFFNVKTKIFIEK